MLVRIIEVNTNHPDFPGTVAYLGQGAGLNRVWFGSDNQLEVADVVTIERVEGTKYWSHTVLEAYEPSNSKR